MGINFDISGAKRDLKGIEKRVTAAAKLAGGAEFKLFEAETKLRVPKDTTALVNSARSGDRHTGSRFSWWITYGNSNVDNVGIDYAAAVHEDLSAKHAPPTSSKYVETPLIQWKPNFKRAIATAVRRAV